MSPISADHQMRHRGAAFTLLELVVSMGLSAIVFAGILGGYTFLARNFSRQLNTQDQDVKSRRAVYLFTQDISAATKVYNPIDPKPAAPTVSLNETKLSLALPNGKIVSYTFTTDLSGEATLVRTENSKSQVLLTKLVNLGGTDQDRTRFRYFNKAGDPTTAPISVKEIEIKFTSAVGNAGAGTLASYKAASPRLVLRNKQLLQ
jgi:type II secretory pathway pseudopilin PulG